MEVKINGAILKWARECVNLSIEEAVLKTKLKSLTNDDLLQFENGQKFPKINAAKNLAKIYGINLAVLYMPRIPKNIQPKINDFRQITNKLSRNAVLLIRKLVYHQEWLKEYLVSNGYKELDFVGMISIKNTSVKETVKIIENKLNVQVNYNKDSKFNFNEIKKSLENKNIFVSIANSHNGNVKSKVEVQEIRGFAIADKIVPFIFINSSDSDNAKLFTLIHELVHILIGETGISNIYSNDTKNKVEVYCNKVASELLIPDKIFIKYWEEYKEDNIENKILKLSKQFPSSQLAIIVKARSLKYIEEDIFNNFFDEFSNKKIIKNNNKKGRADYYKTMDKLNTKKFANYVLEAFHDNEITLRDVYDLLSVKSNNLKKYIDRTL
ncbi:ImmA/IrrE family metallo-endopeptidase [Brachyspira intermedia]|uniref:ImmA/IrrE family metallo-endopeptidase n=1 Tax=Brachyspira intermedia TaxID=84377 RepID=UPI003003B7D9